MWQNAYVLVPAVPLAAGICSAVWTRRRVGPTGRPDGAELSPHAVAFLAGGAGRVVDTSLVRSHLAERLVVSRDGRVTVTLRSWDHRPTDLVDTVVLGRAERSRSGRYRYVRREAMRHPAVKAVGTELAERGLVHHVDRLQPARTARRFLSWSLLLVALAVVLAVLLDAGRADRPAVATALALLAAGLVTLPATRPPREPLTPAGRRRLAALRDRGPWRPNAGSPMSPDEMLLAIALHGPAGVATELLPRELRTVLLSETEEAERITARERAAVPLPRRSSSPRPRPAASSSGFAGSSGWGSCGSGSANWYGASDSGGSHSHSCGSSSGGGSHSHGCGSSAGCGSSCGGGD
ncbi:TIGR04222 domain-containing membrane protein [Kitasatospora sp. NPDC004799]|uniref:TIGR04222 domain-containing membrane protein n=1 Tax=Kitasatospora sp. NPDC004799 TaxID=3154460 RepID=UPI0033ADDBB5